MPAGMSGNPVPSKSLFPSDQGHPMPDITHTSWFPVVTLLLGFATKAISDWIDYKRGLMREREARHAAREEKRYERRVEFQRQTLLDLQESIAKLSRATGAAHRQDYVAYRKNGEWQKQLLTDTIDEEHRSAQSRVLLLAERVLDDTIRHLADEFRQDGTAVVMARDYPDAEAAMQRMMDISLKLNQRIGEMLRKLDREDL
jgi:hypothetical protein